MKMFRPVALLLALACSIAGSASADTIAPVEDVMTSAFFQGTDLVRGYAGDNRPTLRVSTDNAFGTGPETVYITFDPASFASYAGPVGQALLTVQSISGGFGADASDANPFAISAHGVSANPLTSITDNTNPAGPIAWTDFFANNILPASATQTTTVTGLGAIQFDVTAIVNDWISGSNPIFALALTGKNDTLSDGDVLHGIRNNSDAPGSTYLTIVPEPSSLVLAAVGLVVAGIEARRRR
jgi:hypothetical protein